MDDLVKQNSLIWDKRYQQYQKNSTMPGVKFPNEHLVRFISTIKQNCNSTHPGRILEFGFANITNMRMMNRFGFQVDGLEVSDVLVERAQQAIHETGLQNELRVGVFQGNEIPFPDQTFDAIVGLQCVYYNVDQKLFAQECARVLKPGGFIFLSFFTPRHGYMNYIDGEPGGPVTFNESHPNTPLHGLTLFLYKNEEQFNETYGNQFDLFVGKEEYDSLQLFQSWYYVQGQLHDAPEQHKITFPVSSPSSFHPKTNSQTVDIDTLELLQSNIDCMKRAYKTMHANGKLHFNLYPNEHVVRFLANRKKRKSNDHFLSRIGNEDAFSQNEGLHAIEIDTHGISNLIAADYFGYRTSGVSYSKLVLEYCQKTLQQHQIENVDMKEWDGKTLPFNDEQFDLLFAMKSAYYHLDQESFIQETLRMLKPGGEFMFFYPTFKHEYMNHVEELGGNIYRYTETHPNQALVGMTMYTDSKEGLQNLWSPYAQTGVHYFEYNHHRLFSSFHVVMGTKE